MADRFSQGSSRRRYDSEEDRNIQNQLNEFEKKYREEVDVDELLKSMPVIQGHPEESLPDKFEDHDPDSRRVEEIDLDDLGLDAEDYGRSSKTRRGDFGLAMQTSRKKIKSSNLLINLYVGQGTGKNTVMNNPLAALIMSLNIDENEVPVEVPKEEEETEDIDKLIELSHNRDRGVRGQSATGGGLQAINELLDGYSSPVTRTSVATDPKQSNQFWEEVLTVKAEPEQEKVMVEGFFDRKSVPPPPEPPKEEAKVGIKLVSSLIEAVGKPLSFVKNKLAGTKDGPSENLDTEPKVLKTISIDELISQQKKEANEDIESDTLTDSDVSGLKPVAPVVEILPKFSRILAFDDAWVSNIKTYLKDHQSEFEKIKINKEQVTTEASNKLLGIADSLDMASIGTDGGQAKVTTSSVLKLDKVTADPSITNSLSQHFSHREQQSKIQLTPYKLLLEAFSEQEKNRLKECKKRRESIAAQKQQFNLFQVQTNFCE